MAASLEVLEPIPAIRTTMVLHGYDIYSGNTNFGQAYCLAGDIIASKLGVPFLYRYELLGTPTDVARVKEGLENFWQTR